MSAARAGARWTELAREAVARAGGAPAAGAPQACVTQRLVVFRIDGAPYALAVERVREIVRLRPITPVPRLPEAVVGVISLRGQVLQVIDLRRRLGLAAAGAAGAARGRIVVAHDADGCVAGLLVDAVEEVAAVAEDAFCAAPGGAPGVVESLFRRAGRFVSIVDLERVMDVDAAG